mgnify:CR=1 FL=1
MSCPPVVRGGLDTPLSYELSLSQVSILVALTIEYWWYQLSVSWSFLFVVFLICAGICPLFLLPPSIFFSPFKCNGWGCQQLTMRTFTPTLTCMPMNMRFRGHMQNHIHTHKRMYMLLLTRVFTLFACTPGASHTHTLTHSSLCQFTQCGTCFFLQAPSCCSRREKVRTGHTVPARMGSSPCLAQHMMEHLLRWVMENADLCYPTSSVCLPPLFTVPFPVPLADTAHPPHTLTL